MFGLGQQQDEHDMQTRKHLANMWLLYLGQWCMVLPSSSTVVSMSTALSQQEAWRSSLDGASWF
jgi:hypothetical protein